nr:FAD-dependent oxidoreductase [uncultured Dethiosulfovibrio sp.]
MERTVRVLLNGKEVHGYPGQKILDLCAECGVEIPTLCYNEHLSIHGGCSLCLVEVEGAKALVRACASTIAPDMVIRTDTKRAHGARKLALELLLSDHVGDCRPPCTLACPAQANVQGYINTAAQGKFSEALEILHQNIALPSSIGRVCPAPCQENCRRNFVDEEPVSIRNIKRFIGDHGLAQDNLGHVPAIADNGKTVAIVGGGPAGMSAAYYLRLKGYDVTVIEKEAALGGMMRYGIPDYRLPQEVLQKECDWLVSHGIELRMNTCLGKDVTLDQLRDEYDAVLLAMGCWKSSSMRTPGEDLPGVLGGIDFLYTVNLHDPIKLGDKVAVVGGGNTAMDACRCAKRLGAEKVYIVYRRTEAEMPAENIEIQEAKEEGIEFLFLAAPTAIEGNGKVERLICEKMELGEADASGRRRPIATGETFTLEVDNVIAAIGQGIDFGGLPKSIHDNRSMAVNDHYETPLPGVFVCGDQQTGPKIAVEALGTGHWAAESIHSYLTTGKAKKPFVYDVVRDDLGPDDFADREKQPMEHTAHVDPEVRLSKPFDEYDMGLTEEQVLRDSARCMECGCADVFECKLRRYAIDHEVNPDRIAGEHVQALEEANQYYVRNMDKCILCGQCVRTCDEIAGFHAIDFANRGFAATVSPEYFKGIESSDCTFCGLCVQNCPVGALIEKRADRWPHQEKPALVSTTCTKCPVGCEIDMNLERSGNRIVRVTSDFNKIDSPSFGMTCVKGRYQFDDVAERRLTSPMAKGTEISWADAAEKASEMIKNSSKVAFALGADLTNEEMASLSDFIAKAEVKADVALEGVSCFASLTDAMEKAWGRRSSGIGYDGLIESDCILLLDDNLMEDQPVLASWIRRAMRKNGATMIYAGNHRESFNMGDAIVLDCDVASVPEALLNPIKCEESSCCSEAGKAAAALQKAKKPAIIVGKGSVQGKAAEAILALADHLKTKALYPLYTGANVQGAIDGGVSSLSMKDLRDNSSSYDLIVSVGKVEMPRSSRTIVVRANDFDESGEVDLVLPQLSWAEKRGTVTNMTGRTSSVNSGPVSPDKAKDLTWILSAIARRIEVEIPAVR